MGGNQGEGDRESAKHYDDDQKKFVESGKVGKAQRERHELSQQEKDELEKAEQAGKSHAKK